MISSLHTSQIRAGIYSPPASSPPRTLWLITFVDLITLLLAFFVLMFAMSHVESKRYAAIAKSYGETFNPLVEPRDTPLRVRLPKITNVSGDNLAYLEAVLKAAFAGTATLKDVEFHRTSQYLILTLPVEGVFVPGSGAFTESAAAPVFDLGGVLSNLKNRIAVVGTAVMPSGESAGAQAWALALTRAQTMADALKTTGYDQSVTVLGRGGETTDVAAAIGRIDIMIMPERPGS
jgi:chemotaxis protein MotB